MPCVAGFTASNRSANVPAMLKEVLSDEETAVDVDGEVVRIDGQLR